MNQKVKQMIIRYVALRSGTEKAINYKTLCEVYKRANAELRKYYQKEMQDYFDAVNKGLIKPGESILLSINKSMDENIATEEKSE